MTLKKQLGQKIKELRRQRKLTQEQFAEMIGIDSKNISKIENGNNYPAADTLSSIAKALEVDVYELFVFKDNIPYEKMREEVIESLNDNNMTLYFYRILKTNSV